MKTVSRSSILLLMSVLPAAAQQDFQVGATYDTQKPGGNGVWILQNEAGPQKLWFCRNAWVNSNKVPISQCSYPIILPQADPTEHYILSAVAVMQGANGAAHVVSNRGREGFCIFTTTNQNMYCSPVIELSKGVTLGVGALFPMFDNSSDGDYRFQNYGPNTLRITEQSGAIHDIPSGATQTIKIAKGPTKAAAAAPPARPSGGAPSTRWAKFRCSKWMANV
jgi:hypothetical protein